MGFSSWWFKAQLAERIETIKVAGLRTQRAEVSKRVRARARAGRVRQDERARHSPPGRSTCQGKGERALAWPRVACGLHGKGWCSKRLGKPDGRELVGKVGAASVGGVEADTQEGQTVSKREQARARVLRFKRWIRTRSQ